MPVGKIFLIASLMEKESLPLYQGYRTVQDIESNESKDMGYTTIHCGDESGSTGVWVVKAGEQELRKAFEKANGTGAALMATAQTLVDSSQNASRYVLVLGPEVRLPA